MRETRRLPLATSLTTLALLLAASMVFATAFGAAGLQPGQVIDALLARISGSQQAGAVDTIVWNIRVPRVLLGAAVGAALALAGSVIQTLVRNPLADPYLLGISSGASVGATAVIVTGALAAAGVWAVSSGALLGALVSAVLVFGVAQAQGGLTPIRLILTGTVLSSAFSAVASFLVFRSDDPQAAQSVLFWLLGSLSGASWAKLPLVLVVVAVCALVFLAGHGWLDALAAGPDVAVTLGVPVRGMRIAVFLLQAILVGVVVAVAGGIGFVGLIVPHVARLLVGPLHRALLPVAALLGALFLVWVDVAARTVAIPREVPLSVVTGIIGAPIFLYLLGRRRYSFGGS